MPRLEVWQCILWNMALISLIAGAIWYTKSLIPLWSLIFVMSYESDTQIKMEMADKMLSKGYTVEQTIKIVQLDEYVKSREGE